MTALPEDYWTAAHDCSLDGHLECGQSQKLAQHDIVITRAKLYPEVARPGPAWRWTYNYYVDGGPVCQYGPGLSSLRDMLRRKFGTPGKESWKPQPPKV